MGNGASRKQRSSRKYVHKRSKRNGTVLVPPPPQQIPTIYVSDSGPEYTTNSDAEYILPDGDHVLISETDFRNGDVEKPKASGEAVKHPETTGEQNGEKAHQQKTDAKPDVPKPNGYIKKSKHKKGHEHKVHKEKVYKLYDPDEEQIEGSFILRDNYGPQIVTGRPRSYIHYEPRQSGYVVREKVYATHDPRHRAKRIVHTYGTLRTEPEVVIARPLQEVRHSRPRSEIITSPRTVRVIRSVSPQPRVIRAQTIGSRPVIVRRSVSPEKVLTTPVHGYIPRHTLGRYKPKVIDGYVAPSHVEERVVYDGHFSEPGGFREVILEPVLQRTSMPTSDKIHEKEKVPVEKIEIEEKRAKRLSGSVSEPNAYYTKTDDEKLKDIPLTQYFDDGKTIMIIDYLVDPIYRKINKEPQSTSTPRDIHLNGHVIEENHYNDELNDSHHRQRPAPFGDIHFLP